MGRGRGPGLDVVTGQAPPSRPRPPTCFPCLPSITEPLPAARSPGRPGRERCYSGTCTDHYNPTLLRAPECYLWIRLDTRNLLVSAVFIQPGVRRYTAFNRRPPHCPAWMWPWILPAAGLCEPTPRQLAWALSRCPFALLFWPQLWGFCNGFCSHVDIELLFSLPPSESPGCKVYFRNEASGKTSRLHT